MKAADKMEIDSLCQLFTALNFVPLPIDHYQLGLLEKSAEYYYHSKSSV